MRVLRSLQRGNRPRNAVPPDGRASARYVFRRSPLLFLAVALMALAALLVHDSQPAQAEHGGNHLTGMGVTGTVMRGGETYTFQLILSPFPVFDSNRADYTIRVPSELQTITFTPTWTGDEIRDVLLYMRDDTEKSVDDSSKAKGITASGGTLSGSSFPANPNPAIRVRDKNDAQQFYWFDLEFVTDLPTFGGATIQNETLTAGLETSFELPRATGGFYPHTTTYSVTGLPAGLSLGSGYDQVVQGTPESATGGAVTVTYTATDGSGASASLSFDVTVAPPVTFDADDLNTYYGRVITYTAGQAAPLTVTLPEATGGTGTLTYELVFRTAETVAGSVPGAGVHLDSSTRVLTIDGNSNVNRIALRDTGYAISYRARDENGATASASSSISVIGPPTLSDIHNRSYTAGSAVSFTLGAASGPWWKMVAPLSYDLTPQVDGLVFSGGSNPTLSGTPTVAGTTALTYTATDGNGVSTSKTFTVTVVNGPNAPTAAPASLAASQLGQVDAAASWDAVTGATGYVVQVIASDGSYPDRAVNSAPDGVGLSFIPGGVSINGIDPGDYKVRVAARNADGVGPWSTEVSFTVSPPAPVGGI